MFYHVKLKIESLESIGSISFNDIGISGNIFYYCKGEYIPFDSVTYDSPISSVEPFESSEIGLTYQFQNSDYSEAENEVSVDIFASSTIKDI